MKKLLLLTITFVFLAFNINAQETWIEDVYLNDDFGTTGGTSSGNWIDGTVNQGFWTGATQSTTNTFTSVVNTTSKNVEIKSNIKIGNFANIVKTFSGANTPYTSPSGKVTISFICKIGSAQTYSGAYFYFRDNANKPIFGLGFARINSGGNKWLAVRPTTYVEWVTGASSNYANITTPALLPTAADGPALKVTAVLNFTTHTYNMTAVQGTYTPNGSPEWVDAAVVNTYSGTDLAFLDNTASNVANVFFEANGNQTSSSATATNFTFDNFKIAGEKASSDFGDINVKYFDADGNSLSSIKPDVLHAHLSAGVVTSATEAEKASFNDGTNFYVYDSSISTDNVTVITNVVSDIVLKFKKFPLISGSNLTWTGAVNGTWNYLTSNFTSDGVNSLGFQDTNGMIFPLGGTNKTIGLNSAVNLGAGNLNITGTGYNITTGVLGSIAGTGKLNVQLSQGDTLKLGIVNNLTGISTISGGNVIVSKNGSLGTGVEVTNPATLTFGSAALTIPATTFLASTNIVAGTINSSLINGMTAGDGVRISVSAAMNHASNDNSRAFDFAPVGSLSAGSELELKGAGTDNRIGMNAVSEDYLANTKLTLKGNAMFYINSAQGAASTIKIGTLAGESGAKLGWGRTATLDRDITWSVGGSNLDSEYSGSITNTGGYSASGSSYVGNFTNFIKTGTGTLTMSGNTTTHNGTFAVKGKGQLKVTGALGKSTTAITVSDTSVLSASGAGKITAKTLVMGATDTLIISPSAKVVVYDSITTKITNVVFEIATDTAGVLVLPKGLSYSDTVNIKVRVLSTPTALMKTYKLVNDSLKHLVKYGQISLPSHHYTFNQNTGELVFEITTAIDQTAKGLAVYPTFVKSDLTVNGTGIQTISLISLSGQIMMENSHVTDYNKINLSQLSDGAYLVKVTFADGTTQIRNVILNK